MMVMVTADTMRIISPSHTGDSRAVLCRNGTAFALTDDHKAAREDETVCCVCVCCDEAVC